MKDPNDVFVKGVINQALLGKITNTVAPSRLYSVADAVEANGWQADKAFKEQIERIGGMPYRLGRFIVNCKYEPLELGKKGVSENRG